MQTLSALRGSAAPVGRGPRPHLVLAAVLATLASCSNDSNDSSDQVTAPVDLGMTSNADAGALMPYYSDGNLTIYQVNVPVPLPVRRPTQAQLQALGAAPQGTPYPHAPFLTASDEIIEVHYVVSNLDAEAHTIWMLIDPWNEFVRYNPGVTVVSDDETDPNLGYDLSFYVQGYSRVEGDLTSDDMQEIAIKLAAAENVISQEATLAAQAMNGNGTDPTTLVNHIFNQQNWSNTDDPLFTPWVPPVIAGLTGFDLGLRSFNEAANIAVEITMEIQDVDGNHFVTEGSTAPQLGIPPTVISPPAARF
jgi:hypothetical protein